MTIISFPLSSRPHLTRLVRAIEDAIENEVVKGELCPVEILGALEWVKCNVFAGIEAE